MRLYALALLAAAPLFAAAPEEFPTSAGPVKITPIMPVAVHDVLRDLEEICEERRQLLVQRRLHLWLHGWLMVHVPVSFAFLVLIAVHAVLAIRY